MSEKTREWHHDSRYWRRVIEFPNGTVVHHGDCRVFGAKVCTCGLLHDLLTLERPDGIYPSFSKEIQEHDLALESLPTGPLRSPTQGNA